MIDFFEEINDLKHLFLLDIDEPEDNRLIITIKEATISKEKEGIIIGDKNLGSASRVLFDGPGKLYEFYFRTYAAYCVINESFSMFQDNEERMGRLFCIYSKSNYLDYIRNNTIVEYIRDGELKHYSINCLHHTIYIASMEEPMVTRE
ncbi:MAG TPA: hypothetical protein VIM16_06095 [Mucilaginibacter sp.]|jgi:hypothetical protein